MSRRSKVIAFVLAYLGLWALIVIAALQLLNK